LEFGVEDSAEVDDPDEHRNEERHDYGHLDGSRTALVPCPWKADTDDCHPIRPCSVNHDHGVTSLSWIKQRAGWMLSVLAVGASPQASQALTRR